MQGFQRAIEQALAQAESREWGAAALAYAEAADIAGRAGDTERALRAWQLAGETWRRDDQPIPACRALRRAIVIGDHGGRPVGEALTMLAAALGDSGDTRAALSLFQRAIERDGGDVALDGCIGLLIAMGRRDEVRPLFERLQSPLARDFRTAQILGMQGDIEGALAVIERVEGELRGREEAEAGLAAAISAGAELALLDGRPADALEAYGEAVALHRLAGRRSLAWLCEAGRVRALVEVGATPMWGELDAGIAVASDRKHIALRVPLQLARAVALQELRPREAARELEAVAANAKERGLVLLEGRARLELGLSVRSRKEVEHARDLLQSHALWSRRVDALLQSPDTLEDTTSPGRRGG